MSPRNSELRVGSVLVADSGLDVFLKHLSMLCTNLAVVHRLSQKNVSIKYLNSDMFSTLIQSSLIVYTQ